MDRLLDRLVSRGLRRGVAGEPLWLALGVAAWLVRRSRRRGPDVVWSGKVSAGERLVITARDPGAAAADG